MNFKDCLKRLLAVIAIFIVLAAMILSIYCCVTNNYKGAYIIVKLPDGNVVKGYGEYKDIYSNQGYVCIDGTWYRTSYQNVVIMTKK